MNRFLTCFNLCGVLALGVICALQWQANRRVNLEAGRLEKIRLEQLRRIEELEGNVRGLGADLDGFRAQLRETSATLKETSHQLRAAERLAHQLESERDQLKISVTNWADAVAARDERLVESGQAIQKLAAERNELANQLNELALKYNTVVDDLNARTTNYNALVERYNALSKTSRNNGAQ